MALLQRSHRGPKGTTSAVGLASKLEGYNAAPVPARAAVNQAGNQTQSEFLAQAMPFAWVHVPKCGSSLSNFLIHLPGVCPNVPENLTISEQTFGTQHLSEFKHIYDPLGTGCPGAFSKWGCHKGVDELGYDEYYKGHGVIMLRQPEQRTTSAFLYGEIGWARPFPALSLREFAEVTQGCAVRMVAGGGRGPEESCGGNGTGVPPTQDQVQLAIHRLREGFVFVGITEEWELSICLGHAKFGGSCRWDDFADSRVGMFSPMKKNNSAYDLTSLGGFRDPYDGELYEAAKQLFQEDLRRYGLSKKACAPCFAEAGIIVE